MAIDRIGSVGKSGETPEPQRPTGAKKTTDATPEFGEVLAAAMERDLRIAIDPQRPADEIVTQMLQYNDAQLVLAMSILASWEVGRREAVRAAMEARQHEAGMQALLAEFAKRVATVTPTAETAGGGLEQRPFAADLIALQIAAKMRENTGEPGPTKPNDTPDAQSPQ